MSERPIDSGSGARADDADAGGLSRRTFVKIAAVGGVGLTLGVSFKVLSGTDAPATAAANAQCAAFRAL